MDGDQSVLCDTTDFGLGDPSDFQPKMTMDIPASAIGIGFECLDRRMFKPEKVYGHLARLGAKWARCQTGWNRCETEKGTYDFGWLDDVVDNLLAVGVQPWFNITYGNKLYMPDATEVAVGFVPLYYGAECLGAWQRYVDKLARHFEGRVRHFEIWNEPNHASFWHPAKPCAEEYATLVEITASVLRAAIHDPVILGGAMAGADMEFAERLLLAGVGRWIDAYTFHPYTVVPEDNYRNNVDCLRALFARHAPHVRLWQGENGCTSYLEGHMDNWLSFHKMTEAIQAKWALRRLVSDLRHEIEHTSYFHISDLMESDYILADGKHKPVMMGLLNGKTYTPKASYHAVRNLCSLFDDGTVRDKTLFIRGIGVNSREKIKYSGVVLDAYRRHGFPLYVYYYPEDPQCETPVFPCHGLNICSQAEHRIDAPVLIDLLTGKQYRITDVEDVKGRCKETNLLNLPLTDYPLVITDRRALS